MFVTTNDFVIFTFAVSRFCSIHVTGLKNIIRFFCNSVIFINFRYLKLITGSLDNAVREFSLA